MEKIKESVGKHFEYFIIYLEDIESMIDVLEKANVESVEIIVNKYKLESINDISDIKFNKIEMLEITTWNPYFSIKYDGYRVFLYTNENSYENIGIYTKLEEIIIKTQKHTWKKVKKVIDMVLIMPIGFSLGALSSEHKIKSNQLTILILYSLLVFLYYLKPNKDKGLIYNCYSEAKKSFWVRKKDDILLSALMLIFGALITLGVQKMFP